MAYGDKPFGMRQLMTYDTAGANAVALPAGMVLRFAERLASAEFFAEGILVAERSYVVAVDWELEAGGISLAAWARLTGRTATESGTTPNRIMTLTASAGDEFPYFRVYGRSIGDAGDDLRCQILNAKVTSIEGTLRDGQYLVSSCAGVGVQNASGQVYQVVQRETAAVLS
ncbi:MAG: hypothetical protein AB7R40_22165 [Nitrospiraceae bacterium]